jgi:hypothetical protein
MKLSTLPREAAKLQYVVVRAPLTLVERQIMVRYVADDASLRLRFERLLASVDSVAGKWLGDDGLSRRGAALAHRSAMLETAAELEAKAAQRKAHADQQLEASTDKAATERREAQERHAANIAAAARREKTATARARRQANSRAEAEKQEIAQRAQAKIEGAEQFKAAQRHRIAKRQREATLAPKQQLSDANGKKRDAATKRTEAKRLSALAGKERQQRQTSTMKADRVTPHP